MIKRIRLYGIVQGVGFRPFVKREADRAGISGSVLNKGSYVEIRASGKEEDIRKFIDILQKGSPERAVILRTEVSDAEEKDGEELREGFVIAESVHREGEKYIPPDIAVCGECTKELMDPGNRRYLHPFINCTQCGPRFTILKRLPYDRERTSMDAFPMCSECEKEYEDRESRRFDAQPVCCNECGPEVYITNSDIKGLPAITEVRKCISQGGIAAVKGIGGFHLCCDAGNEKAVKLLRERKNRPAKPFAVMMRDMAAVHRECECDTVGTGLLAGYQRPILLLKRKKDGSLPDMIAPGNPKLGVMLPYTPMHILLFGFDDGERGFDALIMTSGNISGAPICITDEEAIRELSGIADIILSNNREILTRADDSVVDIFEGRPYMIRRSRGYAPLPILISKKGSRDTLAIGGELKNTFCIGTEDRIYPSAYIGDLTDRRSVDALKKGVKRMEELLETEPERVICDMHPGYNSSMAARETGRNVTELQHHYAHILSVMAENDYLEPVIGAAFDGTGYGSDGTIWGGEILKADTKGFERVTSIRPFMQPGGDLSSKEGWRIAVSMIHSLYSGDDERSIVEKLGICNLKEMEMTDRMLDTSTNVVMSTGAGRLFDAVSALLGIKRVSSFEGEAAMALEFAALRCGEEDMEKEAGEILSGFGEKYLSNTHRLFKYILEKRLQGEGAEKLALLFHKTLSMMTVRDMARICRSEKINTVAFSGGCFQNLLFLKFVKEEAEKEGLNTLIHSLIPPNDGGIAPGQCLYGLLNQ